MPKQYGGPGPRLMHPSMAWSLSLAKCEPMAQLLFDRLCFCGADDQGRMIADPEVVRGQCMPLVKGVTAAKVAIWLGQLEQVQDEDGRGMILRYEAGGHPLIQIVNWWESQNGMRRAYPSRWPAPDGWEDKVFGLPSQHTNGSAPPPAKSGKRAGKTPAPRPQDAGGEPAERPEVRAPDPHSADIVPAGRPQSAADCRHDVPRSRARAANRTEGTYVPGTELSPLPPSRGDGESGFAIAGYYGFLDALSEATGMAFREEGLSRTAYTSRLAEGFTDAELADAARGVALDPWFMGRNDDGIPRCNPTAVLKSQKLQTWIGLARGQIVQAAQRAGPAQFDAFADALDAGRPVPLRLAEGGPA